MMTLTKNVSIDYMLSFGPKFEKGKSPLIVYLHGAGERGFSEDKLNKIDLIRHISKSLDHVAVMTPSCPQNTMWDVDNIYCGIQDVIEKGLIDKDRIYITGFSMGGRAVWDFATTYPHIPAAIIPASGFSCYLKASRIKDIPTFIFHGVDDQTVPHIESIKMFQAMKECGGKPRIHLIDYMEHENILYSVFNNKMFVEWLLQQNNKIG